MKLSLKGIQDRAAWERAGIQLPQYDVEAMREATRNAPMWVHFGAGNIFRAFLCSAMQRVLDAGACDRGIIACETYDGEIIDRVYTAYDNLSLVAIMRADGTVEKRIVASVAEAVKADEAGVARMKEIFRSPSLQMVTLTVTEKAYKPENPMMRLIVSFLGERYLAGKTPLAIVSMDNCAHNGDKLHAAMMPAAEAMAKEGAVAEGFLDWMKANVAFPNTMIDKITPHPDAQIEAMLEKDGVEDMGVIHTEKHTVTAGFVNAEQAEYLVVEDSFPNGRPPLEKAGILFTDKETVDKVEKMKVGTCLNPLHTALAILGCLLGFTKISAEMADDDLSEFVDRLGYVESLPVVQDPGVLSPKKFLDEVIKLRLPNPFLPDTPQRIATDTSQKLAVRFGHTIGATADKSKLHCVPFVLAAWFRYLTGVDDEGNAFTPSPDPRMDEVRARMAGGLTDELLSDTTLFGHDLVANGMAPVVRAKFSEMMQGKGAVRAALKKVLSE